MHRIKRGRYRHFKGSEYEVIDFAFDSETQQELVIYRALYGEGYLWVRSLAMFSESVERDGQHFLRFTSID
jgi:hypothetical protein